MRVDTPQNRPARKSAKTVRQLERDATRYRYIALIELNHTLETGALRDAPYVFEASDGKVFFGETFTRAVDKALRYDRRTLFFRDE
jgi:hypothetical protein